MNKNSSVNKNHQSTNSQYTVPPKSIYNSKKLRKLPHIFSKVLQLPIQSNADVLIEETLDCFRFTITTTKYMLDDVGVRAQTIDICPGVSKVVILGMNGGDDLDQLDTWRYRLPASTKPEMATAKCIGRQLVVTVPKATVSLR